MSQVHNPLHTPLISDLPEPSVSGSHAVATSPAVEQEIRPEAARPAAMPVAVQLQGAQKRLDRLLGRASGHLPCLTGSVYAELARNIPRPGLFSGLRRTHGRLMDAARACDKAAAALAGIPARSFAGVPLPEALLNRLSAYTKAQNALYGEVRRFMEASGNDSALLSSLLQSTQYRASEALNLVASLQLAGGSGEGLSAEQQVVRANMRDRMADMGDMTVSGGMKALAPGMHERTLQRRVAGQMRELFDALDRLEQQGAGMSEQQFRREAADVRDVLDRARAAVALLNTDGMSVEDRSLHAGLNDLLDRCAVRLGNLSGCSLHGEVVKAVDELMPVIDPDMCRALASKTGLTRLRNALMDVAGGLARYNADLRALKGDIQAGASSPDRVRSGLMQAWRRLRSGSTDKNSTLLYALYLAGSGGLSNSVALRNFLGRCGVSISVREAVRLFDTAQSSDFCEGEGAAFLQNFAGTLSTRQPIVEAQAEEIAAMYAGTAADRAVLRGEYIAAAFEHNVAISTLLEASLRGIPTDQLELKAGSDTLRSARVLGHGAANTVTLCVYRGENGENVPLVFKPETAARQGFPDLTVYRLGYRAGARVMQINVAASRSADAAGCGDAVARSRIGVYDGRVGLFMEKAPGSTACDLMTGRPCVPDGRGNKLTLGQVVSGLRKKGLLDDMRANLMRELNRLEWADALSGQADRHYQNYLVDINPETGAVKVTGIDNDASFGARKVGVAKVDIAGRDELRQALEAAHAGPLPVMVDASALSDDQKRILRSFMPDLPDDATQVNIAGNPALQAQLSGAGVHLSVVVDGSTLNEDQLGVMRRHLGFNQLFRPSFIDRETYEKLRLLDENAYRMSLRDCLDDEALDAAAARLRDAKSVAEDLARRGRVVDDWKDAAVLDAMKAEVRGVDRDSLFHHLHFGFFQRDFLGKV